MTKWTVWMGPNNTATEIDASNVAISLTGDLVLGDPLEGDPATLDLFLIVAAGNWKVVRRADHEEGENA